MNRFSEITELDIIRTLYYVLVYLFLPHEITVWEHGAYESTVCTAKLAVWCVACLKQLDLCQESFVWVNIVSFYPLYIQETILYVKENCMYITDDQIHTWCKIWGFHGGEDSSEHYHLGHDTM